MANLNLELIQFKKLFSFLDLSLEEISAPSQTVLNTDTCELNFDCYKRISNHAGTHITLGELFKHFEQIVDKAKEKKDLSNFLKSKEFLNTLQFMIFEFMALLRGEKYEKGIFLENLLKAVVFNIEVNFKHKLRKIRSEVCKAKSSLNLERLSFQENEKTYKEKVIKLEKKVREELNDKRQISLQMDRYKNQILEYNQFHNTIRLRIRAFGELSKHLQVINHNIPQIKQILEEFESDNDLSFVKSCIEQLEVSINNINNVYIENDINYTRKYIEGFIY